jgi:hypothetical protein
MEAGRNRRARMGRRARARDLLLKGLMLYSMAREDRDAVSVRKIYRETGASQLESTVS